MMHKKRPRALLRILRWLVGRAHRPGACRCTGGGRGMRRAAARPTALPKLPFSLLRSSKRRKEIRYDYGSKIRTLRTMASCYPHGWPGWEITVVRIQVAVLVVAMTACGSGGASSPGGGSAVGGGSAGGGSAGG